MTQPDTMSHADAPLSAPSPPADPVWPGWLIATAQAIRFFSRLPVPPLAGEADPHAAPDFRVMPRALPVAALLITLPAALVMLLATALNLPAMVAATLAVAALVITTGAFHEDGLADSCDGLFGGATPERRLEIMKDSRIGTFGGCGLVLALMLRVALLAEASDEAGGWGAALLILAAAPWSRATGIWLLSRLDGARAYGAVASVGRPTAATARIALGLAAALGLIAALIGGLPAGGLLLGFALAGGLAALIGHLAQRLIGGPTGDIAGAAQQLSEIGLYLGVVIALA